MAETNRIPAQGTSSDSDLTQAQLAVVNYRRRAAKKALIILFMVGVAGIAFVIATIVGPFHLTPTEFFHGIFMPHSVDSTVRIVLWDLRLPSSVMAVLIGAALALAGAHMQTILDNPLAEPFTLGISAAAAFGGAASIVLGWTLINNAQLNLAAIAWLSSLLAVIVVVAASVWRGAGAESMILLGIALVFLFQALLSIMQYQATLEALQQIVFWTLGSLQRANWTANAIIAVTLAVAIPYTVMNSWKLTALRLGDARAAALGINVTRLRVTTLIVSSVLAASAVAFAGIIGFVGLVGPHVARILVGEEHRFFAPASMAAGAFLLTVAHAISITIIPGVAVPVGIITSLVGVPFFILLLLMRRRRMWG
ncbi:FecCD family ABC transporter permease [Arcanobacterium buesumense]|uniref:Iron ABC transporter permease n=1 Tax=Arcanobacterium buesumense TaxID=2722751 RepID=A0A6H2EMW0_9ACTO|nr:iron ABC transporter permease [Arcanobacterium buesumense]QJC22409.1 iron ABC transporter permease [Arcanobacterium buesumense]